MRNYMLYNRLEMVRRKYIWYIFGEVSLRGVL